MYMIDECQNDDSSSDDEWASSHDIKKLIYFVWMVQNINKHRTIDLYNVNSQQE